MRKKKGFSIGRIIYVNPSMAEKCYLRVLLNTVPIAMCYEDIKRVNGVCYELFKDACDALGELDNEKNYIDDRGKFICSMRLFEKTLCYYLDDEQCR